MTFKERARKAIEDLELGLRKKGVLTTGISEVGYPILFKAFKQVVDEFEKGVCPAVESVKKAVPDLCEHCKSMILFAMQDDMENAG